ncbi:MAG: MerR family transcriptional regulator [Lautropia sp.]|nr:MerR family transcriptional regulator [Lautropia sp.]
MSNSHPFEAPAVEVLGDQNLTIAQLAKACHVTETWVVQRVQGGVVYLNHQEVESRPGEDVQAWRFTSQSLLRTRRIADLERIFDADPELAAMTADLMEEVKTLRRLVRSRP